MKELRILLELFLSKERIKFHFQLVNLLNQHYNFIIIGPTNFIKAQTTIFSALIGIHLDVDSSFLYVLDLGKKIKMKICWMCGKGVDIAVENRYLLCENHCSEYENPQ